METKILEEIGFTPSEIKIYLTLLKLGSSSAGAILEKSESPSSVLHNALNSLIQKGFVTYIYESRKKIYQAAPPENLITYLNDKKEKVEDIIPELKKVEAFSKDRTKAEIYKGRRGVNELYNLMINKGAKEYNTFGGGSEVSYDVMGEEWWKLLHAKRVARKLPSRQLFDMSIKSLGDQFNKLPITKIKFLPKEFRQLQETVIVGDSVAIVIFTENPYGILIEDAAVAQGYRKQFELMWKNASN